MSDFVEKNIVTRFASNPILKSKKKLTWANIKIYNPAILYEDNKIKMIFRAIGNDWISRLGYAETTDNMSFNINPQPLLSPLEDYESHGIEDPRLTKIGDQYILAYTAYDGKCARLALTTSTDLHTWARLGPVFPYWDKGFWQSISQGVNNWSKAGALFPEKIHGKYTMLFGDHHIWYAQSDNLVDWEIKEQEIIKPRPNLFDQGYVEMGAPPIKTEKGWLILYHGVQRTDDAPKDPRVYRLGAALLDLQDPTQITWQCTQPLLEPKNHEKYGLVDAMQYEGGYEGLQKLQQHELEQLIDEGKSPLAIFTCGAYVQNNQINIYYSSADTAINLATCTLDQILQH